MADQRGRHDHERRQVLRLAAEAVGNPRADARPAGHLVAREQEGGGGIMVDGFGVDGLDDGEFIHDLRGVREQLADQRAALAVRGELVNGGRDGKALLPAGHRRQPLAHADRVGQVGVEEAAELGLVVPQVEL